MRHFGIFALACLGLLPLSASSAEKEERTYTITADKKLAGSLKLVIEDKGNGIETAAFAVNVSVRVLIKEYKYSLRGYEVWNKDQLMKLETQTEDDGTKMSLKIERAEKEGEGLLVTINDRQGQLKSDVWTTTYWKMPGEGKRVLMDADTGKILDAKWDKVGVEALSLMGQKVNCTHWRVSGAANADLWYDGSNRLVRQETVESRVRMVTELKEFKK